MNFSRQKHKSLAMSSSTSQEKIEQIFFTFCTDRQSIISMATRRNKQRARGFLTDGIFDRRHI